MNNIINYTTNEITKESYINYVDCVAMVKDQTTFQYLIIGIVFALVILFLIFEIRFYFINKKENKKDEKHN